MRARKVDTRERVIIHTYIRDAADNAPVTRLCLMACAYVRMWVDPRKPINVDQNISAFKVDFQIAPELLSIRIESGRSDQTTTEL